MKAWIVFFLVVAVAAATPALMKDAIGFVKDLPKVKIEPPKFNVEMPKITIERPKEKELPKLEQTPEVMEPMNPEEGDDMEPMDPEMFAIFANYADPIAEPKR